MNPSHKRNVSYPDVIAGFCTATLENCPDHQLNENHCQTIQRFFRNNLYTHTLSIVVYVRLWESPANYLRKHLGLSNYWTRSNGTVLRQTWKKARTRGQCPRKFLRIVEISGFWKIDYSYFRIILMNRENFFLNIKYLAYL